MAKLILVPTSIVEIGQLCEQKKEALLQAWQSDDIICVEDLKPARRRWRGWGLPREAIADFVAYNEHTREEQLPKLIEQFAQGKNVYLMSDGGMPAFCDPGRDLVDRCHRAKIPVEVMDTDNSVAAAMALSGLEHDQFYFAGFPPQQKSQRAKFLDDLLNHSQTCLLMDTPYRLERLISELAERDPGRLMVLCLDLAMPGQQTWRQSAERLLRRVKGVKREFVLVIAKKG